MKTPLLLAALAASAVSQAHYLWATLDPAKGTVAVALQEIPGDEPVSLGERAPKVRAVSGAEPLKADGVWLKAPAASDAVGVALDYGVLDRTASGRGKFWLRYYAKAAATPEASAKKTGLPVEISAAPGADGRMVVTVWHEGKPAANADVIVENPVGTNAFEGKTGADGTATLPASSGPLAVRALVTEQKKGEGYDLIRSYSTLTLASSKTALKTISRELRDAFGKNHEVVSQSVFIETVMANKLTKAQLADHLQQRLYVHEAIDSALSAANVAPYGAPQKEVLTLLKANLADLNATGEAWPLTRAFVEEIKGSKSPYFALGVFHVYYGGITNGGRDIGAMIAEQTKFTPTYYLKSDGYRDYLTKLNTLPLTPEERAETVRGGLAAYRYIIAINNEPTFKTKD